MQQLPAIWQGLDTRRRIIVLVATLATFAAVYAIGTLASRAPMALLYAGLDGGRSGEVLASLEQRGAAYEVRGDAIYVETARRDELRMALAGEGLPSKAGSGYELLDSLSGFGTTAQMFDAAYWRAKEGELARTIASNPHVRSARVHIANGGQRGLRQAPAPKASVTVTTAGGALPQSHVSALRYLVASAVAGMAPEDVAVIDTDYGLMPVEGAGSGAGMQDGRAAELRANVERLLVARVGPGHAVVEVSVDTVTERESITERRIDPQGRVPISTDTEEKSESATDKGQGAVTVASNLPDGDAAAGGSTSQSQNSASRERINYEVSETTRELLRAPGAIRRLTVAVLIDGVRTTDAAGAEVLEPRPEEELASLRDLVASAVGYDEQRGDVITVKSMPFDLPPAEGTAPEPGLVAGLGLDLMRIAQLATLAAVSIVLGLFVLKPVLTRPPLALPAPASGSAPAPGGAIDGEIDDGGFPLGQMNVVSDLQALPVLPAFPQFGQAGAGGGQEDPVARLRSLVEERQDEAISVLRTWMDEPQAEKA